jgi:putative DNA primase/helicase
MKTYLAVPYSEKDEAKGLGAKWDAAKKAWYIEDDKDKSNFKKWMSNTVVVTSSVDPYSEFKIALEEAGLIIPNLPIMDGKIHRVSVDGDSAGKKSGSYKGFVDGHPAGFIQNFKLGYKGNWKSKETKLSKEQIEIMKANALNKKLKREQEIVDEQNEKAIIVRKRWLSLEDAPIDHPFLVKKKINVNGTKINEYGNIVIPMHDINDDIWSLQRINDSGIKAYEKGAKKSGMFYMVGQKSEKYILIAEGFSTASSLNNILSFGVYVAFDSGNILEVLSNLKSKYPDKKVIIFADDDHSNEINAGLEKAYEASEKYDGKVFVPQFSSQERSCGFTDFNDLINAESQSGKLQIAEILTYLNS